jgi:hypothetical protein
VKEDANFRGDVSENPTTFGEAPKTDAFAVGKDPSGVERGQRAKSVEKGETKNLAQVFGIKF